METREKDVIIIGAGAAGLICAAEAGRRKRSVLILDHAGKIGSKIRISGGGHCNFTNIRADAGHYLSRNPHFCKSALARFTPAYFTRMVERHGIRYYEKENGQLFCREGSGEIIGMLQEECDAAGVEILLNCLIREVRKKDGFIIGTSCGTFRADSLVIATGGLSYPELGATGLGYRIALRFGLTVTPLRPALVPLTLNQDDLKVFQELSGLSFTAQVRCNKGYFVGDVLFTHRGLSGPAILQISSYWKEGDTLTVNLFPHRDVYELFQEKRRGRTEMRTLLSGYLPRRLAQKLCESSIPSRPMNHYHGKELEEIAHRIRNWEMRPVGTEGYKKAEVTLGGVETGGLSSKTMEARNVAGLYFIGEVVDVTGQLGGYNLQWAWSSGYVAGQHA